MRIAHDVLSRFVDVPADPRELRGLLDDLGLEVKRSEGSVPEVFTLELLANRGDHHCYEGVATELNGRLRGGVRAVPIAELQVEPQRHSEPRSAPYPVRVETDLCLSYTATLLERVAVEPLPAEALRVLEAAGIHSLGAVVDATNVANLELGQPTHAFDADTLVGPVVVRRSRAGERAWLLFAEAPVEVPEGTMVIADDAKILAIAGVIGCEESKTTGATTRVLLESACFDPVAVRKASRALDTHTDSSARFERGADPTRPLLGAGRVVALLEQSGWRRIGATGVVGDWTDPKRRITLHLERAETFLGTDLDAGLVTDILTALGFEVSGLVAPDGIVVDVPPRRLWDVVFEADLHEELAKAIGYNATPIALPPVDLGAVPAAWEERRRAAEEVLLGAGFYEVFTDGFYGRPVRDQLGLAEGHPLWAHVATTNALERNYALLKNQTMAQALDCVATNARMRHRDVKAYEWTRTFHPGPVDGAEPVATGPDGAAARCWERKVLWAIASGLDRSRTWASPPREADVWYFKGLVAELGTALGLELVVTELPAGHPQADLLHPGRRAAVALDGATIGVIGEVHPRLTQAWKLKKERPVFLELLSNPLVFGAPMRRGFEEPPEWQPIVRSLAFGLPQGVAAADVAAALRGAGPDWLLEVAITDRFVPAGEDPAITFELVFANAPADRRTAEQVNEACERMAAAAKARWPVRQR